MEKGDTPHEWINGPYYNFNGANINNLVIGGTMNNYQSNSKEEVVDKSNLSDDKIARAIEAICGDGKPLDSKRKWAAVHWCLRWYCNFPPGPKEFCERIEKMKIGKLPYKCEYDCIRHFSTFAFMNQDARQMDKVRVSRTEEQYFRKYREIVLALAEELGKSP